MSGAADDPAPPGPAPGPAAAAKWTEQSILWQRPWTERMFSFATTRDSGYAFAPGQFARLGVADGAGGIVWRPHSMVSADSEARLEFLSITVPHGQFTNRVARLQPGEPILVERVSYGFLTPDRFHGGRDLWMLASGTGVGPYVAILRAEPVWRQYENLVVVHSVREAGELAYRDELLALAGRGPAARYRTLAADDLRQSGHGRRSAPAADGARLSRQPARRPRPSGLRELLVGRASRGGCDRRRACRCPIRRPTPRRRARPVGGPRHWRAGWDTTGSARWPGRSATRRCCRNRSARRCRGHRHRRHRRAAARPAGAIRARRRRPDRSGRAGRRSIPRPTGDRGNRPRCAGRPGRESAGL